MLRLRGCSNKMSNIIVTLLAVSVGITLQGCDSAPWLDNVSYDNSSNLLAPCQSDADCLLQGWEPPYQQCLAGGCRCRDSNPCQQRTITANWETYSYYCGQCGDMGSSCNFDTDCPSPFANCYDGYCKCYKGNIFHGICRVDNIMSSASTSNILLCFVLLLLLVLNKVVASNRVRILIRRAFSCCINRGRTGAGNPHVGEDGVYHNPRSGEKSASYTISNSDFITSSDDPDLDWAIELSRQLQLESSPRREGNSSTRGSIRSRASNTTRSSTRSRASNTSRRSVVSGTETTRRGGRNEARTATSTGSRETIDEVSQTISGAASDATAMDSASGNTAFKNRDDSMKIDSDKDGCLAIQEDKLVSTLRNVDENTQTCSQKEKFLLNTITTLPCDASEDTSIVGTVCNESSDPLNVSLRTVASTSSGGGAIAESTLASEISSSTQQSRSKKSPSDETECGQHASNIRGSKVTGRGRKIILVPRKIYNSPRNSVAAIIS